jgi:predicted DNA-binding transcriptional regulator AlpA
MKLLTNDQTAELIGLKSNTLEIWRWQGKGPVYRKIGRLVRYAESDVFAWLDAQTRQNTSQYATHVLVTARQLISS